MKFTKHDIDFCVKKIYDNLISTYGLVTALRISKKVTKLLNAEKKRRHIKVNKGL